MFTILNLLLTIVLIVQVVKVRREIAEIDCPALNKNLLSGRRVDIK